MCGRAATRLSARGRPFATTYRRQTYRPDEYDADHVRGARHVPLHEVEQRHAELPRGVRVWVYCAGGFRAGTATSLLHRAGVDVVHVDDAFTRAVALGLTVG
jgi:hydroxyacylglutathione hydrolase